MGQNQKALLAHDSRRRHLAWGGARLCERNPRSKVSSMSSPRSGLQKFADRLFAAARFTGLAQNSNAVPGFRSQSLAPPQATSFRLLRRLFECLLSKSEKTIESGTT